MTDTAGVRLSITVKPSDDVLLINIRGVEEC